MSSLPGEVFVFLGTMKRLYKSCDVVMWCSMTVLNRLLPWFLMLSVFFEQFFHGPVFTVEIGRVLYHGSNGVSSDGFYYLLDCLF
jgi:hypothetical protein